MFLITQDIILHVIYNHTKPHLNGACDSEMCEVQTHLFYDGVSGFRISPKPDSVTGIRCRFQFTASNSREVFTFILFCHFQVCLSDYTSS